MKKNICFWSRILIVIAVGLFTLGMIFCESGDTKDPRINSAQQDQHSEGHMPQCDEERCVPPKKKIERIERQKKSTIRRRINKQQSEIKRRIKRIDKKLLSNRKQKKWQRPEEPLGNK